MVWHTFELILCGLGWALITIVMTIVDILFGGIIGFIVGGIIGVILALILKLFSWGRFPKEIGAFTIVIALVGAIVYAIAGVFEFLPSQLLK